MMKAGNAHYTKLTDLPGEVALFPLEGVLLLPNGYLPLNVFEERYLEMVEDTMKGNRIIGIIQPHPEAQTDKKPELFKIGCLGRITNYSETGDGRLTIGLQGICRFTFVEECATDKPYRIAKIHPFEKDLVAQKDDGRVDRESLLNTFESFLEAHEMEADWGSIMQAPTTTLVNALSIVAPFGIAEKQALLEAEDTFTRAQTLIALTERALMFADNEEKPSLN